MSVPYEGDSTTIKIPGLKGVNNAPVNQTNSQGNGLGVEGVSVNGEAVRGESSSVHSAAVHGLVLNPSGTGAGTYGESRGKGAGILGVSLSPENPFDVERNAPAFTGVAGLSIDGFGVLGVSQDPSDAHGEKERREAPPQFTGVVGMSLNPDATQGAGVWGHGDSVAGVRGETNSLTDSGVAGVNLNPNGSGAGVFGATVGRGPAGFFQGDVTVTGNLNVNGNITANGDIFLPGADLAEHFDMADFEKAEPGTVMVINQVGALEESQIAYDRRVAGVISGAGKYTPGIVLDKQSSEMKRSPIALVGKVYCKVDAAHAPIEVGDMLTTSSTPGHAMKAGDPHKAFGSVIGKALYPIKTGRGLIPILIALQ
jgi:hypothetical protein